MALTLSNIAAVLKKVIAPEIQNYITKECLLLNQIKKNVGVRLDANNTIYVSARVGRHSGIYSVAEGTEPGAGKAKYAQPYTSMKYAFGTLELTDQAIEAAQKADTKALASILTTEIEALKNDFKLDINRQLNGSGTGVLATLASAASADTSLIVGTNPAGLDANDYFAEGMWITINATTTVEVTALVGSTGLTVGTAVTAASGLTITKKNADEAMGLKGIIDDGDNVTTIQSIVRATYAWANSFTDDSTTAMSESALAALYLKTLRFGGAKAITMGETQFKKYMAALLSYKKTANLQEMLSGGWQGLEFVGGGKKLGVFLDFDCPSGYAQLIDFDKLALAEMSEPFSWLQASEGGGILSRSSSNRTIWEATMKYYFNLVALGFKSHARMSALT